MSIRKMGKNSYRFECMIHKKRFAKTFKFYTESRAEIEMNFSKWKVECEKGMLSCTNYTVEEFAKIWLENYVKPTCCPNVIRTYNNNLKNWIIPNLGSYKMQEVTPLILDDFIAFLRRANTKYAKRANSKLSNGTIAKIYENVRTMFGLAYKKGIIVSNPCDRVSFVLKKTCDKKNHCWTVEDYKRFLILLDGVKDKLKAIATELAVKSGVRRSEAFGLEWDDFDEEADTLHIWKTRQKVNGVMVVMPLKTPSSERTITIPRSISEKLKELHKVSNTKYIFEELDYDSLTAWYRHWIRKNNLPYITYHDLRHTHASLLLCQGIDIKTISERLGHSSINTTMNIYTHVMKELDVKASEAIEAV